MIWSLISSQLVLGILKTYLYRQTRYIMLHNTQKYFFSWTDWNYENMDFYYSHCNMMILVVFSHDFFTTGICYPQKSLYTVKLDTLHYNILKNENDMTFFHRLVGL